MTEFDFIPKKFVIVSDTEPAPFEGLIWYNPNEGLWRLYKDGKWQILIPFYVGDSEPAEKTDGMLWYDTYNDVMKIWDAGAAAWQRLGIDWADIVNKPSVFPPDYTNYPPDWADIVNKPDAFKPDYANYPPDWNDLINKPLALFANGAKPYVEKFSNPNIVFIGANMIDLLNSATGKVEVAEGNVSANDEELTIIGGTASGTGNSWIYFDLPSSASKVYVRALIQSENANNVTIDLCDDSGATLANPPDLYRVELNPPGATADFNLYKNVGGSWTKLAGESIDLNYGEWYDVEIFCDISNIKVWRDGVKKFDVSGDSSAIPSIKSVRFLVYDGSTSEAQKGKFKGLVVIIYE